MAVEKLNQCRGMDCNLSIDTHGRANLSLLHRCTKKNEPGTPSKPLIQHDWPYSEELYYPLNVSWIQVNLGEGFEGCRLCAFNDAVASQAMCPS